MKIIRIALKNYKSWVNNIFFQVVSLLIIEWLAFHKIFSFWFFHGWEASWLMGNTGGIFTLRTLMQSHGFISALNLLLFGWNPQGWFATAFILHFFVTIALMMAVSRISKKKLIGFIAAVLFIATTADHDVITWGSFESLYAAQTLGFYLMLLSYLFFRKTQKKIYYIFALGLFAISAVLRESGIIFIPLIFLFELLFFQKTLLLQLKRKVINKKQILSLIKLQLPFWILGVCYLFLRASYGGSPYDYIDQRVQLRILLLHEYRYLEYIWYGLLSFGQYIPPYILPYPVLNTIKTFVYSYHPTPFVNNYFFVITGWIIYIGFCLVLWLQRKNKYRRYLLFLFLMFSLITFFYCYAWTADESFLSLLYSWSENRWRYFAFTALAPFLTISIYNFSLFLQKRYKKELVYGFATGLIVLSVIANIFYLNKIENQMYWENHYPSIRFYQTLTKAIPQINTNTRFYYYRNSPYLNDFLAEFYYIKQRFYPKVKTLPTDWVRSQMFYIVKYLSLGEINKSNFYFIDYSLATGVVNKTAQVLKLFRNQQTVDLIPNLVSNEKGFYTAKVITTTPVDFPSFVHTDVTLYPDDLISSVDRKETFSDTKFNALSRFISDEVDFMHNTTVTVCKTMDNQVNEEFHNFTPQNIIDGNIQDRSRWWADCRPAWVTFDLGHQENIAGFAWGSYNAIDYVPRDYMYQVSSDGVHWKTIDTIYGNVNSSKIDKLSQNVNARYIRFYVLETVKRGMLVLNEFSVIPQSDIAIFSLYNSQKVLFSDMYTFWDHISDSQLNTVKNNNDLIAWIPFSWTTKPDNLAPSSELIYYIPMNVDGTSHSYKFELPESELYSGQDQFLKRFMTSLSVHVPFKADISSLDIVPMFPNH